MRMTLSDGWKSRRLFFPALLVGCALLAANMILGDLNQDEGWYLYAARLVHDGEVPYRDFAYTQAPVLPFVYAIPAPLVGRYGLIAGRFFTAVLGLAGALVAAALAARLAPQGRRSETAVLAFVLIMINVYQAYFCAVVKTYSLAGLFLVSGFLALSMAFDRRIGRQDAGSRRDAISDSMSTDNPAADDMPRLRMASSGGKLALFLSGVFFVLAAGTRSSAGIVLPIIFLFLCLDRASRSSLGWLWFGLGGGLAGCAITIPFLVVAPESFRFCVFAYHTMRESGGFLNSMIYKAGFVSRMIAAYFVPMCLLVAVAAARLVNFSVGSRRAGNGVETEVGGASSRCRFLFHEKRFCWGLDGVLWACVIGLTLVHILAPFPYDDYQVFVFPVFAAGVAALTVRFLNAAGIRLDWALVTVFMLCLAAAISSPINQDWFVQGRDRIWWRLKTQPPLVRLREAGALIRGMARPGDILLTQDPYLAVESGLTLPRGLEMGQFCYFPDFSDEEAAKLHVMNRNRMLAMLRECDAPVAALSGYAFAIRSPQVEQVASEDQAAFWAEVYRRYESVCVIPDFGQAFTTLKVFRKR